MGGGVYLANTIHNLDCVYVIRGCAVHVHFTSYGRKPEEDGVVPRRFRLTCRSGVGYEIYIGLGALRMDLSVRGLAMDAA